jgi:predicted Ser/Thr protein kinase
MSYGLEKYSLSELKIIADKLQIPYRRSRTEMIEDIKKSFSEYEEYKKEKIDKYTRSYQLGEKGKEGTTFLVTDHRGKQYAMKTFRKQKSSNTLYREYSLQKKASKAKIAPKVHDYDTVSKYIVMEKMDSHLFPNMDDIKLTKSQQHRLIEIFQKLDKIGVFHNDINLLNFMVKKGEIFLIDYGFSKEITPQLIKKLGTDSPNYKYMTLGLVLKLKEANVQEKYYKYLAKHISKEDKLKYKI